MPITWVPHEGRDPAPYSPPNPSSSPQKPLVTLRPRSQLWCWPFSGDVPTSGFALDPRALETQPFSPWNLGWSAGGTSFLTWAASSLLGMEPRDVLCVDRFWHGYRWSQCYSMHKTLAVTWHFKWCLHHAEVSHFEQTLHCLFPLLSKMFSVPPGQTLEISLWKDVEWTGWKAMTKSKSVESPSKTMWCKLSGRAWVGRGEEDM